MAGTPPRPPRTGATGGAAPRVPGGAARGLLLLLLLLGGGSARRAAPTETSPPTALGGFPGGSQLLRGEEKPAAHVVASFSNWPWRQGGPGGGLVWSAGVAPAWLRAGVRLEGNRLVVPRDGLYFVYAAAAFQGGACPTPGPTPGGHAPGGPAQGPALLLRLSVSRFSEEYPRDVPLLSAVRSVCTGGAQGRKRRRRRRRRDPKRRNLRGGEEEEEEEEEEAAERQPWFESLYQGAVFQLRRGDRLEATPTPGRFLDLHGGASAYFGVLGVD